MRDLPIVCPAATAVYPPADAPSVVCGVLENANDGAELSGSRARGHVSALMSGTEMATTVHGFCAGAGIPGSVCSYTACSIWRAEKQRIAARRRPGPDALRDDEAARPPAVRDQLLAGV